MIGGTLPKFGAFLVIRELIILLALTMIVSTKLQISRFLYFFFNFYDACVVVILSGLPLQIP